MSLAHEIVLEIFKFVYDDSNRSTFPTLLQLNWAYYDLAVTVLWSELNSLEPLLHLMPEPVIERHSEDGQWQYTIHRAPSTLELERFYVYAPLIRAIRSLGPSIDYDVVDGFSNILQRHSMRSLTPLLPHLNHLELAHPQDPLLRFIPHIIHGGVRSLILPNNGASLDLIISRLLQTPPSLQSLVCVSLYQSAKKFASNIHLFPSLRDLTIRLLEASAMQTIVSHPSLRSLTLVIFDVLPMLETVTFSRTLLSFNLVFLRLSLSFGGGDALDTATTMLRQFPVPCQQLSITLPKQSNGDALHKFFQFLAHQPNHLSDVAFSPSKLTHITVHGDGPLNCVPLPSNFLQPLYRLILTHVDLASFNMCHLDDEDLRALSDAMPHLQRLSLGNLRYWSTPPRASLAGVAHVLRNCPALTDLGLVFSCSLGGLDFDFLPVNKYISILNVGISPPYNDHAVAYFLSRSLPNLCRTNLVIWSWRNTITLFMIDSYVSKVGEIFWL